MLASPLEWYFIRACDVIEHRIDGLIRDLEIDEDVHYPMRLANVSLVHEGILLEKKHKLRYWKDTFRGFESATQGSGLISHSFIGLDAACCHGVLMNFVQQVAPCVSNVCWISMIGGLVNEEANVKIPSLIGVRVVQLSLGQ